MIPLLLFQASWSAPALHISLQAVLALAELVQSGVPSLGGRVYVNRVTPVPTLPAAVLESGDEDLNVSLQGSVERTLEVGIGVLVKQAEGYDAAAYELLMQIEHLVAGDPTVGGVVNDATSVGVQWERFGDAELPVVRATLRVRVTAIVLSTAVDSLT